MGLFERTPQRNVGEEVVFSKMCSGDLLRMIMGSIQEHSEEESGCWLKIQTNYYDDRQRTVLIDSDGIVIKKCAASKIADANEELEKSKKKAYLACLVGSDNGLRRAEERRDHAVEELESIERAASLALNYTWYGYTPLPTSYIDQQQHISMYRQHLLPIWARAVQERFKAWQPGCTFSNVTQLPNVYMFSYEVPELEWKSWF